MAIGWSECDAVISAGLFDPSGTIYTQAEKLAWFNYYVKTFCRLTKFTPKASASYTWTAGVSEVALTAVIPNAAWTTSGGSVTAPTEGSPIIDIAQWIGANSNGRAPLIVSKREAWILDPGRHSVPIQGIPDRLYYDEYDKTLGLSPTPADGGTLQVFYTFTPRDFLSTDDFYHMGLDKLEPYYMGICQGAVYMGRMKDIERFSIQQTDQALQVFGEAVKEARMERALQTMQGTIDFQKDYPGQFNSVI